jgi:hypothetical protein
VSVSAVPIGIYEFIQDGKTKPHPVPSATSGVANSGRPAAGASSSVYRLFTKDLPPFPAPKITAFYASVLVGLAVVMHLVPGEVFPHR